MIVRLNQVCVSDTCMGNKRVLPCGLSLRGWG
jgi:hypothetical protein